MRTLLIAVDLQFFLEVPSTMEKATNIGTEAAHENAQRHADNFLVTVG
jgi:hypothetical protein